MIARGALGVRAAPGAVAQALRSALGPGSYRVQDAGPAGLWAHGDPAALRAAGLRWARALGRPVRLYRVAVAAEGGGVRLVGAGEALHPDGRATPIAQAAEDVWDPGEGDLPARAEDWLRIVLEIGEGLDDHDSRSELWDIPVSPPTRS